MSNTDSPEYLASRLSSEISRSESKTHTLIIQAESRLDGRIRELEMKLISSGAFHRRDLAEELQMLAPPMMFFVFMLIICLTGHSRESTNTEPAPQATHSEAPAPQSAPTPEEGK
jgi:hypothetical protein